MILSISLLFLHNIATAYRIIGFCSSLIVTATAFFLRYYSNRIASKKNVIFHGWFGSLTPPIPVPPPHIHLRLKLNLQEMKNLMLEKLGQLWTVRHICTLFWSAEPNIKMYTTLHLYRVTTFTTPSAFKIELTGSEKGGGKEISPALDTSKHSATCGVQNSLQEKCFMYLAIISPLDDKPSSYRKQQELSAKGKKITRATSVRGRELFSSSWWSSGKTMLFPCQKSCGFFFTNDKHTDQIF